MSEVAERVVGVRLAPVGAGDSRDAASRVGLESASAARAVGDLGRDAVGAVRVGAVQHHLRHVTGPQALGSQAAGGVELVGEPRAAELAPGLATSAVVLERETAGSGVQRHRPAGRVERPGGHGSGRGLASGPPPGRVVGVSICTGAFALAEAGLLDGLHATTHWQHTDDLEQRYPGVRVEREVLYMDEGDILTAAGVCCGIDLRLHLRRALNTTPTAYRRAFTR